MKILDRINSFFGRSISIFYYILQECRLFLVSLWNTVIKLRNLKQSNIEIGLYHFYHHNFSDALMRFKFVHKFLDKNNKKILYYLGWVYFVKQDYIQAMNYLKQAGDEDEVHLKDFIANINNVTSIPKDIGKVIRDLKAFNFSLQFIDNTHNIPEIMISRLMDAITSLPDEYKLLDIGSNNGLLGREIKTRMPEKSFLVGVESSEIMIDHQKNIDNVKFYEEVKGEYISDFINTQKEKYDIIISLSALSYSTELDVMFNKLHHLLNEGGYIAFATRSATNTYFAKDELEFMYDIKDVLDAMGQNGFNIKLTEEFLLENKNKYYIVVASK